jgi:hypothetical protein
VLVQSEHGGGLRVRVGPELVEEQGEGVFVVGYEGGEGGVVRGEGGSGGFEGGDAGLQRRALGGEARCWRRVVTLCA